jgi:hypothetical protein
MAMDQQSEDRLDEVIDRFGALMRDVGERQARIENRVTTLFQLSLIAFVIVVVSLSFLTILLSRQVPGMTAAITEMNDRFASIADDMVQMERSVESIGRYMETLPLIIGGMDRIHGSVAFMSDDVSGIATDIGTLDTSVGAMAISVADMRQSFELVERSVGQMGADVNRLSQPMRMFNFINPFR